jgi:hypothetical protein
MLTYIAYDKETGKIVHIHRAVDNEGRTRICTDEEVLSVLPAGIPRQRVGVISTTFEEVPSSRAVNLRVDVTSGTLVKEPIKTQETTRRR